MDTLTPEQQEAGLRMVAEWMGRVGYGANDETPCTTCGDRLDCEHVPYAERVRPAPTGEDAAHSGLGPVLVPDFDWSGTGARPTVVLEGGPDDWPIRVTNDKRALAEFAEHGIYAEPYSSTWALSLYPA